MARGGVAAQQRMPEPAVREDLRRAPLVHPCLRKNEEDDGRDVHGADGGGCTWGARTAGRGRAGRERLHGGPRTRLRQRRSQAARWRRCRWLDGGGAGGSTAVAQLKSTAAAWQASSRENGEPGRDGSYSQELDAVICGVELDVTRHDVWHRALPRQPPCQPPRRARSWSSTPWTTASRHVTSTPCSTALNPWVQI